MPLVEELPPADLRRRIQASLLDLLLVFVLVALPIALSSGQAETGGELPNGSDSVASITLDDRQLGLVVLIGVLYGIVTEATLGATVGKLVRGLRVRRHDGSPLGWGGAAVRNVLRLVDGFPYFVPHLLGVLVAYRDRPLRRRLGDRAAGSIVVSTRGSS